MSKNYILVILMLSGFLINAQEKTKEEVMKLIAEDTCECISDKDKFLGKSRNEKQMALGLCMINSYNKRKGESDYFKEYPVADFEAMGEEVGMYLLGICSDDFMSLFTADELMNYEDDDEFSSSSISYSGAKVLNLEATLDAMENNSISTITMIDDFDKQHTFIILKEVEGVKGLRKSNFKKSFYVEYQELDIYDLSEKRYVKKKVLKSLKKL